MNPSELKKWTLVTRLEYLAAGGEPAHRHSGICDDLRYVLGKDHDKYLIREALHTHPLAVDRVIFPIPDPQGKQDSGKVYCETADLWVDDYGALRRDFAAHAARYLRGRGYA